jgi:hypothetical protein
VSEGQEPCRISSRGNRGFLYLRDQVLVIKRLGRVIKLKGIIKQFIRMKSNELFVFCIVEKNEIETLVK